MTSPGASAADSRVVVDVDLTRKVLHVHFCGVIRPENARVGVDQIQEQLPKLGRGFVLVTDLSELESMELNCFHEVTRMMDTCFAAGLAQVIRIIPDPRKDIGFQLLALIHYHGKIPTMTCRTRAEAERELAAG